MVGRDGRVHVTFEENVSSIFTLALSLYLITLALFSIGPLVSIRSKNEVTQKGGRDGGLNKSVTRLRNFMEFPANSRIPMLLLHIHLESKQ